MRTGRRAFRSGIPCRALMAAFGGVRSRHPHCDVIEHGKAAAVQSRVFFRDADRRSHRGCMGEFSGRQLFSDSPQVGVRGQRHRDDLVLAFLAQEVLEATLPGGTLHPRRRVMLPVVAGIGGVLGSIAVYAAWIFSGDLRSLLPGWAIASAVDFGLSYLVGMIVFGRGAAFNFL